MDTFKCRYTLVSASSQVTPPMITVGKAPQAVPPRGTPATELLPGEVAVATPRNQPTKGVGSIILRSSQIISNSRGDAGLSPRLSVSAAGHRRWAALQTERVEPSGSAAGAAASGHGVSFVDLNDPSGPARGFPYSPAGCGPAGGGSQSTSRIGVGALGAGGILSIETAGRPINKNPLPFPHGAMPCHDPAAQ